MLNLKSAGSNYSSTSNMLNFSIDRSSFRNFVDNWVNCRFTCQKMFPFKLQLAPSTFYNHWYLMKIKKLNTILKINRISLNFCNFRQIYMILCKLADFQTHWWSGSRADNLALWSAENLKIYIVNRWLFLICTFH